MLSSLHIRNYVLIDSLDIDFPAGLVIITGQTGAGKSILLGALGLLLGGKSDASVVSSGADNCVVEAEFDSVDETVASILADNDVDSNDGSLIVRRVVGTSGRSRSFINDCPVPVAVLSEVSSHLVDIHSQHQSLLLCDRAYQMSLLDHFAGNSDLLVQCRSTWTSLQATRSELKRMQERIDRMEAERSYNEAVFARLDAARLRDGELEELEAEQRLLSGAESVKEDLERASELLCPADEGNGRPVSSSLKELQRILSRLENYLPSCAALAGRVESVRLEVDDIEAEVESMNGKVDVSPGRLEAVENRMSELYDLMHRHSCNDVASLILKRDELSAALYDSDSLKEQLSSLQERVSSLEAALADVCGRLRTSRSACCGRFASEVTGSLRFLELDRAVFDVVLEDAPRSASGADSVVFKFSADGVAAPSDVAKCASGGEMSRIMLCLKAMMARYTNMPTMIFDEIDTGVSGSVADRMGSMICEMGKDMQIFAITHLPQVAAKGVAHYLVSKETGERTVSSVKKLDMEQRVQELARMLSGSSITEAAVANARALLDN